ncbi:MAG: hypothetical protein EOS25_08440 [Mesorhizobium sp.]|nr:hypothetical protein EOA85_03910 [Mesorhizobium sp. M5C.F.Ca.IN.020.29.1.1]RWD44033.1 MAG: hypothetical protein EOS59_24040 [Mesorhizobium sp.]RWE61507.1 MAG: hypothetical protein EOS24_12360 [Mesorhizobium sp.]RWF10836.1 MAG: hypothetical protein EOS69_12570 [Mesorhizobium sp.]RWF20250.1 MAG: hypothetical protein EOS25_08440 [Mesorhizobium sp.]
MDRTEARLQHRPVDRLRQPHQLVVHVEDLIKASAGSRSADAWCRAYTFDAWNRKCFLKGATGQLLANARATSGVLSSLTTPTSSGANMYFEYFNNKAFPGDGFRVLSAQSRDECGSECWDLNQCAAFSFTASQRRCVLFDQPGEYSSSRGSNSGAKRQD